jgi:D-3-phosphoglycerate dehydrogenase
MSHDDKPGIVGRLGTVLGTNNVNIAGLYVGRQTMGGKAVAMVNVDTEVTDKVLQELKGFTPIHDLRFIKFI